MPFAVLYTYGFYKGGEKLTETAKGISSVGYYTYPADAETEQGGRRRCQLQR